MNKREDQHDKAVEDSFPASDPPRLRGVPRRLPDRGPRCVCLLFQKS